MTQGKETTPASSWKPRHVKHTGDDDDDGSKPSRGFFDSWMDVTAAAIPQATSIAFRSFLGVTLALYVLNQKHMLPRPVGAFVSKGLFWPTLPITVSRRIGKWVTRIDQTVVMGGAPFGFLNFPEHLYEQYGVRGVINMCEEYKGPARKYKNLGIEELYLPTTDHFEPSVEDLISAISFIKRHEAQGKSVYVHCRAGHGRSAAAVFAWLLYKDPIVDRQTLNTEFCKLRNVRKKLWKQTNIMHLHNRLMEKGTLLLDISDPPPKPLDDVPSDSSDDGDL